MKKANTTEIAQPDPIVAALNSGGHNYLVKYNVSPGLLTSLATKVYPSNPNVLFTPVVTAMDQSWVEAKPNVADQADDGLQELIDGLHSFSASTPTPWTTR